MIFQRSAESLHFLWWPSSSVRTILLIISRFNCSAAEGPQGKRGPSALFGVPVPNPGIISRCRKWMFGVQIRIKGLSSRCGSNVAVRKVAWFPVKIRTTICPFTLFHKSTQISLKSKHLHLDCHMVWIFRIVSDIHLWFKVNIVVNSWYLYMYKVIFTLYFSTWQFLKIISVYYWISIN